MADQQYWRQFTPKRLRREFFDANNVEPLETLIEEELARYEELEDVGIDTATITLDEASDHLKSAHTAVEGLFEIEFERPELREYKLVQWNRKNQHIGALFLAGTANLGIAGYAMWHGNLSMTALNTASAAICGAIGKQGYDILRRTGAFFDDDIYLMHQRRTEVLQSLPHELTHNALDTVAPSLPHGLHSSSDMFAEGVCNAVESNVIRDIYDVESEPSLMKSATVNNMVNLYTGYSLLCDELGREPRIDATLGMRGAAELSDMKDRQVGHAMIRLWEQEHGTSIYADIAHEHFTPIDVYVEPGLPNAEHLVHTA